MDQIRYPGAAVRPISVQQVCPDPIVQFEEQQYGEYAHR
jgi:hypothetical protein